MNEAEYQRVIDLDNSVYPTPSSVTVSTFISWYKFYQRFARAWVVGDKLCKFYLLFLILISSFIFKPTKKKKNKFKVLIHKK